jgi:hypothetical protein
VEDLSRFSHVRKSNGIKNTVIQSKYAQCGNSVATIPRINGLTAFLLSNWAKEFRLVYKNGSYLGTNNNEIKDRGCK